MGSLCTNFVSLCIHAYLHVCVCACVCVCVCVYTARHYLTNPFTNVCSMWGYAVAQLVEALRYKPEGRGFDS